MTKNKFERPGILAYSIPLTVLLSAAGQPYQIAMPRITISADAAVYQGNPHDQHEVTDAEVFRELHGIHSGDQYCSQHVDPELVESLGLQGGRVRFCYSDQSDKLRVATSYSVDRKPTPEELSHLVQATEAQWSDGIGSGEFGSFSGSAMSTSLAMALVNQDPDTEYLSEYFVDAWPMTEDRHLSATWSNTGSHDDFMIRDLREGVRNGDADAEIMLASMYMDGDGVEQDQRTAVALLARSVQKDEEVAGMMLATALLEGNGVEASPEVAIRLLNKSAADGSPLAVSQLGDIYKHGRGVPAEPEKAIPLLQQAADVGFLPALAELGDCYEHGIGVDADSEKARQIYDSCMQQGFEAVAPAIARLDEQSNESPKSSAAEKFKRQKEKKTGGGIFGFFKRKKK